jgi:hypothetical protein
VLHLESIGEERSLFHDGLGVRWSPFARSGLYVQSTLGYAERETRMDEQPDLDNQGLSVANVVGYVLRDGHHDWALDFYVEHQVAYLVDARAWTQGGGGGFAVRVDW